MSRPGRFWPMTRPAVIYMLTMVGLYLLTEGLGVFGASALPVQNVVGTLFFIATIPAGLVVFSLALIPAIATGNVSFGDSIPFLMEFIVAVAVFLNALLINGVVRRTRRRHTDASTHLPNQ